MKKCFKCGESKELSGFYCHPRMADGHLGKCKECTKRDVLAHRTLNIERIRAYDRKRGKLAHRIRRVVEFTRKRRREMPIAYAANNLLNYAVRAKRVTRPAACSACGLIGRIHGHHEDYYKPLEVIWLCTVCHARKHLREKAKSCS